MMARGDDGTIYITRRHIGDVVALPDANGDGKADAVNIVVWQLPDVHGIAIHDSKMYLATVSAVYVADMAADGTVGPPRKIIGGLPPGGRHANRTLAVGPDNKLYVTIGSTGNANLEPDPRSAGILRADLDGKNVEIFCSGLRNDLGMDWHPKTGQMWGMDNGIDWLGSDRPPEELNLLEKGKHYGWPFVSGKNVPTKVDKHVPPAFDIKAWTAKSTPSVLEYTAHTAPLQSTFYRGSQFPPEYRNDYFVAMHGSGNAKPPVGYEVVRVHFRADGTPEKFEPFVGGFVIGGGGGGGEKPHFFGRPAGIVEAKDGALMFTDDINGVVYRVSYGGSKQ
jgi:glucose/arabinose dehydrogenase